MTPATSELPIIERARAHRSRTAVTDGAGSYSYKDLLAASERVATHLLQGARDLEEARVAFLCPPSVHYVATLWGIWRAGGVAVPLCITHPVAELEHVLDDAEPAAVVAHPDFEELLRPPAAKRRLRLVTSGEALEAPTTGSLPAVSPARRAMMVYTSGTTAKPKAAVTTHANIQAQVSSLIEAWRWTEDDRVLLTLPLHHVHGIINVLTCALWSGAHCDMLPRFDAERVWARLREGGLSLYMAVPIMYHRLIATWEAKSLEEQTAMASGCRDMRLMVSGSAALPVGTVERWKEITHHTLLERYGMTEAGMILSNPLDGERVPGSVGAPLPGVEVRLVGDGGQDVPDGEPGTVWVRGPGVFLEYWKRLNETAEAFRDGWFVTGDVAVREDGRYRILGRESIDIIKTGGYKVSALEVEDVLRAHPDIAECAVVGILDEEWGERVCVAVEQEAGSELTLAKLKTWAKKRLAPYKIPGRLLIVDGLPRNALGKVTKSEVAKLFL